MASKNLYALLVGIDEYPIESHRLFGCHNDVQAAKTYLDNRVDRSEFNLHIKTLLSAEATRNNIVRAFEEHLAQAGEDDIAFFFYSGHGAQEPAGSFFSHLEPDGKNETFVCWDSRIEDGMDLADKEMATLLQMVSQKNPHLVTLIDCCHSGGATRKVEANETGDFLVRQTDDYEKQRPLDSYIFPRDVSLDRSVLAASSTQRLRIPKSRHVALTAAESFQTAKETTLGGSRRGVFSYSLFELLQNTSHNLSYEDLMRRVRGLVSHRTFEQDPTFYVTESGDADLAFLGGSMEPTAPYFLMSFDREKGWELDAGSVHGIIHNDNGGSTILAVFAEDEEDLDNMANALGEVQTTAITAAHSIVEPVGEFLPARDQNYRCRVLSLPVEPNKVFFFGETPGLSLVRAILAKGEEESAFVKETLSLSEADYKLIALNGQYIISRAADGTADADFIARHGIDFRPLVEQVPGFNQASAEKVLDQLVHITRWERSLELRNPQSDIEGQVKVELLKPGLDELIQPDASGYRFSYKADEDAPEFRVRLRNLGSKPLFCSLIYFSSDFAADPNTLDEGGLWLDPGATAWVGGGFPVSASVSDNYIKIGRNRLEETFKLMVSTEKFEPNLLEMPALGQPKPEATRSAEKTASGLDGAMERGLKIRRQSGAGKLGDWTTDELTIVVEKR
ncbi:MAG: caspase family protein [Bacteroidia bacterium]